MLGLGKDLECKLLRLTKWKYIVISSLNRNIKSPLLVKIDLTGNLISSYAAGKMSSSCIVRTGNDH